MGRARRDRSVLLTGMMGSGKSSVGRILAERLMFEFIDTDERIESECGVAVSEIFAHEGEAGFRRRERQVLEALPERGAVIALGGGAIVSGENRSILAGKGTLVWLDASPEQLAARLEHNDSRPLLAGLDLDARIQRLRELALQREAAYAVAALRISTDGLSVRAVSDAVLDALQKDAA